MRNSSVARFLALAVVVSFVLAGPLAPLARAQQPAQPAQPTQPDLFQETLKAQHASDKSQGYYNAGAVAVNIIHVPGKALTCGAGGALAFVLLVLTLGTGYRPATYLVQEGCGGKWVLKGDDLRPDRPAVVVPEGER